MTTDNKIIEEALSEFKRSVEITRDVRFQANLRLAIRQVASSYIISILSLYVISLSLVPNILSLKPYQSQILLACSIVLSVFIIFTSLLDSSQNFFHKGELLHSCARKVATINHKLKSIDVEKDPAAALEQLNRLQIEYQAALDECPTNHDNVDFYKQKGYKPHLFPREYQIAKSKIPELRKIVLRTHYYIVSFILSHIWMSLHLGALIVISIVVVRFVLLGAQAVPDTR
jgi:hypothetical protein